MWAARLVARRRRDFWGFTFQALVVAFGLALAWLVLAEGRSSYISLVDVMYVPVLLAAFWFRKSGAAITAVVAALVAGPLLPAGVVPGGSFGDVWVVRFVLFLVVGVMAGHLSAQLDRSGSQVDDVYAGVTHLYARTLRAFMRLLEFRDEETSAHCDRVARNALAVGHYLGLDRGRLETLYWAGYLHDLGKLATPAAILIKPGKLTELEYEIIKDHAAIGADVLVGVSAAFGEIAVGVRHHHERWDGRGYPDGLSGRDIPVFGRILAVVDMFEAMTSDRPYRKALPVEAAREIVERASGAQVDPEIAELFLRLEAAGKIHVEGRDGKHTGMEPPDEFQPEELQPERRGLQPVI